MKQKYYHFPKLNLKTNLIEKFKIIKYNVIFFFFKSRFLIDQSWIGQRFYF